MSNTINVAVTGVGGASGQGIMKALMSASIRNQLGEPVIAKVYPVDITALSAGVWRGMGGGTVLPKPERDIDMWLRFLRNHNIKAVIPGSDYDLAPLAAVRDDWWNKHRIRVLVSDPAMIAIANDKALTIDALDKAGVPTPETTLEMAPNLKYPVVVKPRSDAASRGVHICMDTEELKFHYIRTRNPMIQEYLTGDEYTCAAYLHKGEVFTFIAKRTLYAGSTYIASVQHVPHVAEYVKQVALALRPRGVLNVQLIDTPDRGPLILEVNARCSGSTAIRAHFGYNEPQMLIEEYVFNKRVFQPEYRNGTGFRYWDELFIDVLLADDLKGLEGRLPMKGSVPSWL